MATRRDKEETRQLLLEAGFEMMLERGLEVGWGIRVAEVTERVGLTTGAAYQIWSGSRTRHGAGGQDRFHHDLALYAMDRLISEISETHIESSRALAEDGASLDLVLNTVGVVDWAWMADPATCALFLALIAAAASDTELAKAGAESYQLVTDTYVSAFANTLEHFDLEMVEPHTLRDLVVAVIAIGDGLAMRSLVDPTSIPGEYPHPVDVAEDATGQWHLYTITIRTLIRAMTRPRGGGAGSTAPAASTNDTAE